VISELMICHLKICSSLLVPSLNGAKCGIQLLHGKCYLYIMQAWMFWNSKQHETALVIIL